RAANLCARRFAERRPVHPTVRVAARLELVATQEPRSPRMSASPATSSTRAAASANWSGHRPLSAIAAAAGGGVPQARIRRVLQDLLEPLARLHAQGQVHGAIAMSTIGLDTSGKAHLLVPPLEPAPDAEGTLRIGGYAAFEQYTDDPEHPCGPWTDVYALSAVAHTMVVGAPPPAALARCVKDTDVPLARRELGGYDADFLRAVDQGLSMNQQARAQSMEALAAACRVARGRPEAAARPAAAAQRAGPARALARHAGCVGRRGPGGLSVAASRHATAGTASRARHGAAAGGRGAGTHAAGLVGPEQPAGACRQHGAGPKPGNRPGRAGRTRDCPGPGPGARAATRRRRSRARRGRAPARRRGCRPARRAARHGRAAPCLPGPAGDADRAAGRRRSGGRRARGRVAWRGPRPARAGRRG